jgi:hypothetical protein
MYLIYIVCTLYSFCVVFYIYYDGCSMEVHVLSSYVISYGYKYIFV